MLARHVQPGGHSHPVCFIMKTTFHYGWRCLHGGAGTPRVTLPLALAFLILFILFYQLLEILSFLCGCPYPGDLFRYVLIITNQ
ncbi:TPA: hypothetical protein ACI00M_001003 [Cronobacter dublinensis]